MLTGGMPTRRWRRRPGLSGQAAELVGTAVAVALPLQRHRPVVVFAACVAEILALAGVIVADTPAAFAILVVLAVALVVLAATNRRRVLAVTTSGVVQLAASRRGRPTAMVGPAPSDVALPAPRGLGCPAELDGRTWWVDRSAYPRLASARRVLATGDGSPESAS